MKLSAWAKKHGVCYKTAWRMWNTKTLPVPAYALPTGTIVVVEDMVEKNAMPNGAALYARVSGSDQKSDLDRQVARLTEYATANNMPIVSTVKEIGSGLNGHRKGLMGLLANTNAQIIIVEHRDRLMRFGFEYVEQALLAQGRKIVVVETQDVADDIVRDLHEIVVSVCARIYGKRSAKNRAKKAMAAIETVPHDE